MSANRLLLVATALCAVGMGAWLLSTGGESGPAEVAAVVAVPAEVPTVARPSEEPAAARTVSTAAPESASSSREQRADEFHAVMAQKRVEAAADALFAQVAADLDLTEEESEALQALLREERQQAQVLIDEGRRDEFSALREQTSTKVQDLLGDERFETYTAARSQVGRR